MKSNPPLGLGEIALQLWNDVTTSYQLRPDELRLLADACREVDLIEQLQAALPKTRFTTRGSMGQTIAHPLLGEIRQHRSTLASLLKQLKLFDLGASGSKKADGPKTPSDTSTQARKAANARWGRNA